MRKKFKIILISVIIIFAISTSITLGIIFTSTTPSITTPSARYGYGMVYDESVNKVILFGGGYQDGTSYTYCGDTWIYDPLANLWIEIFPQQQPTARHSHSMAYDPIAEKIILFGGIDITDNWIDDTWIFDSRTQVWTQIFPDNHPSFRGSASIFYDPQAQKVVLFGGFRSGGGHLDDTWAFDYSINNWTNLNPSIKPTGRYGAPMVYDLINQRGFMFGGRTSTITNETWVYYSSNNSWSELSLVIKPPNRYWEGLVYDEDAQRIIAFGGSNGYIEGLGDTWIYNPLNNQWVEETPNNSPENRVFFSLVYVPEISKVILFGGASYGEICYGDTWAFHHNTHIWNKLN